MKNLVLAAVVLAITGCGGGAAVTKTIAPTPTSNPTPPPPPDPTPAPPPSNPQPPPPAPVPPTPQLVGKGINPLLNIVNDIAIIAFNVSGNQTQVTSPSTQQTSTYAGGLDDFQAGNALTEVHDPQGGSQSALSVNGSFLTFETSNTPAKLQGQSAVWSVGNSLFSSTQSDPLYTALGQILEFTITGSNISYAAEVGPSCDVYVNGIQVSAEGENCAQDLKLVAANGNLYVGWDDFDSVYNASSADGQNWTVTKIVTAPQSLGQDFVVNADGSVKVVWTQFADAEDGSSVWASNNASITRLSAPVRPGFSGAGNPAIAQDGSVAWLDDSEGDVAGDFAVVLNGVPLTSDPGVANDEGPVIGLLSDGTRVVVWGDQTSIWEEEIPE